MANASDESACSILSVPPETLTPMMRQYQLVKAEHPDAILMFRLGDFFEMFFEDAVTAAGILQITLTSRGSRGIGDSKAPIPMCGVPFHAVNSYVARLVEAGHKVTLCDQIELSDKGIARREVTRVVTPGMVIDDELGKAAVLLRVGQRPLLAVAFLKLTRRTRCPVTAAVGAAAGNDSSFLRVPVSADPSAAKSQAQAHQKCHQNF